MDVVLQGPVFAGTLDTARAYLRESFVERVILACWDDESIEAPADPRIVIVRSKAPDWPGQGNVNCQIVSSAHGLAAVQSRFAAKLRSDQRLAAVSMRVLHEFAMQRCAMSPAGDGHTAPCGPLTVIGAYEAHIYPFHPQDHVFVGHTADLRRLFDVPLSNAPLADPRRPADVDYRRVLRANAYLGTHYVARFDARVREMLAHESLCLLDGAPEYAAACALSAIIEERYFTVAPRIELAWEKRRWATYPFDLGTVKSEYWYEAPW